MLAYAQRIKDRNIFTSAHLLGTHSLLSFAISSFGSLLMIVCLIIQEAATRCSAVALSDVKFVFAKRHRRAFSLVVVAAEHKTCDRMGHVKEAAQRYRPMRLADLNRRRDKDLREVIQRCRHRKKMGHKDLMRNDAQAHNFALISFL